MAINKINTIRNVGRFQKCSPSNKDNFGKFTFIYADNGSGKTTFCSILRSLKTGDSIYLRGRKTLGSDDPMFVSLTVDGRSINYEKGVWTETLPNIEIFDDAYIYENVYATDGITHDNKKNLYQLIIGSDGVTYAREYERLDNESRAATERLRQQEAHIMQSLPQGILFKHLQTLACPDNVDAKIADAEREIVAIREIDNLRRRASVQQVSLPLVPNDLEVVLSETIAGIANDVSKRMVEHIAAHNMREHGEQWLSEGLRYQTEDCPFCKQSLVTSDFAPILKGFFSEEYNHLKQRVARLQTDVATALGDRVIGHVRLLLADNASNIDFWSQYCEVALPELNPGEVESVLSTLRNEADRLVTNKSQSILEPVSYDVAFANAMAAYTDLVERVQVYNEGVQTAAVAIERKKQSLNKADLSAAQATLNRLVVAKELHYGELRNQYSEYSANEKEWLVLDRAKKEAKAALDVYTESVMRSYQGSINRILELFNAGFRITNTTHDYKGTGTPRTVFQIEINGVAVNPGDSTTPLDQPSFKNTLSAGDKSALAFAFFWAQLESKDDLSNTVIVLDDPFSSQDNLRRNTTATRIGRSPQTRSAAQVFLLSHDKSFLKDAIGRIAREDADSCVVFEIQTFRPDYAIMKPYSLEANTLDHYERDKLTVQLYLDNQQGTDAEVIRCLRQLLETHFKTRFREKFTDGQGLGDITTTIRNAGENDILYPIADELEDINLYTRQYHHGNGIGNQPPPINQTELRGYALRVLKIIGAS